jgi:hypothetical protein
MVVAFDIASFPIFKNGELYYPGLASLLAIIHCGGRAIIFSSTGHISRREQDLIGQLAASFEGRITAARDSSGADMFIS